MACQVFSAAEQVSSNAWILTSFYEILLNEDAKIDWAFFAVFVLVINSMGECY